MRMAIFLLIFLFLISAGIGLPNKQLSLYVENVEINGIKQTGNSDVILSEAPNGLSGYNLTISLCNPEIATIKDVIFPSWATLHINSSLPSNSVWIKAVDLNNEIKENATNIVLATIVFESKTKGSTGINLTVTKIDDDQGYPISGIIQNGVLKVTINHPPVKPYNPTPANGATSVGITTTLSWQCSDADNDAITYDVYFGMNSNPPKVASNITSNSYNPTLDYGKTYYWRIVAWDGHGAKNVSQLWHFTTKVTPQQYTLTTSVSPSNAGYITLNPSGGIYDAGSIVIATAHANNGYTFDHWGGDASGTNPTITITMNGDKSITAYFVEATPPNQPPTVAITSPLNGSNVNGTITIHGNASDDKSVVKVEIRIDGGTWIQANGTTSWSYSIDTTTLRNGQHKIEARSYDGSLYSDVASIVFNVFNNHKPIVAITSPLDNAIVKGSIFIKGKASDEDGNDTLQKVEIRIDSKSWHIANGTTMWQYGINTKELKNGIHTIEARSYDGHDYSDVASIHIEVKNKKKTPGFELIMAFLSLITVILIEIKKKRR